MKPEAANAIGPLILPLGGAVFVSRAIINDRAQNLSFGDVKLLTKVTTVHLNFFYENNPIFIHPSSEISFKL